MIAMAVHLGEAEAAFVRKHAELEGKTTSDFIRDTVLEKIDDQEDLAALRTAIEEDDGTRYTHEQVLKELGLQVVYRTAPSGIRHPFTQTEISRFRQI